MDINNTNQPEAVSYQSTNYPVTQKSNLAILFGAAGLVLIGGVIGLLIGKFLYAPKNNPPTKSAFFNEISTTPPILTPTTSPQDNVPEISVRIEPYRLDDEGGQIIATFQINNLNKESNISKVTYWTDKSGACKAKTEQFSEFTKIPANEINDYAFFQFTDEKGGTSEIYASSHNPIFQCGKLAE